MVKSYVYIRKSVLRKERIFLFFCRSCCERGRSCVLQLQMEERDFNREIVPLRDRMFRFAQSLLLDRDEAEDTVHDLLERLWSRRERLAVSRNIEAFAMTAVRNACYDRLRRRQSVPRREELGSVRAVESGERAGSGDLRELVRRAMAQLPARQREILHLKEIEGYSTREIAELYASDEGSVRMTLTRARRQMRTLIEKMI